MVLLSPKLGVNPKSELPFVVDFSAPTDSEFKGKLYPEQILPSEVTAYVWFYLLPHQHDKGRCLELPAGICTRSF